MNNTETTDALPGYPPVSEFDIAKRASELLRSIVEGIESLEALRQGPDRSETQVSQISDDIKSIYYAASDNGYDMKAMWKIVRIRKKNRNDLTQEETEYLQMRRMI